MGRPRVTRKPDCPMRNLRIGILVSHPIQYFAPVYKAIAGVEGVDLTVLFRTRMGVAEYFDLDVSLLRVVWAIVAILGAPIGIVGYIVGWIVMPNEAAPMFAPAGGVQTMPAPTT